MKMTQEHYNKLNSLMKCKLSELEVFVRDLNDPSPGKPYGNVIDYYENGKFPRADKVKDLQRRFCFDLFSCSVDNEFISELYEYLNDNHIETALRRICPVIKRKY